MTKEVIVREEWYENKRKMKVKQTEIDKLEKAKVELENKIKELNNNGLTTEEVGKK